MSVTNVVIIMSDIVKFQLTDMSIHQHGQSLLASQLITIDIIITSICPWFNTLFLLVGFLSLVAEDRGGCSSSMKVKVQDTGCPLCCL